MIKSIRNINRKEGGRKKTVPNKAQDIIPIDVIYEDGIFRSGERQFSRSFCFTDINYAVAGQEERKSLFIKYRDILNSLDSSAVTKFTVNNRRIDRKKLASEILIPKRKDGLDEYRREYNSMLMIKTIGSGSVVQDKYLTVTAFKDNVDDARRYFARIESELSSQFSRLGSKLIPMSTEERLKVFYDFYRMGEESDFAFDLKAAMQKGHSFKDYISPDSVEIEGDHFKVGEKYGRVLFLKEYARFINDTFVTELTSLNRNLMLSIDMIAVPTDEAVREVESKMLGVETNVANWQRRQNANNNFSAVIPYDMEQQRKETREFLEDLTARDQRMIFAVITMVHVADSLKQLDEDTETIMTTARSRMCQLSVLKYQQMEGLNTVLPAGVRDISLTRTFTSESLAAFNMFNVQEVFHKSGIFYGVNSISKNLIMADRMSLMNGNSFVLGVSGSGKSFITKEELAAGILTHPDVDYIIVDPEREFGPLISALGGEIIKISSTSPMHINAMDINEDYGDGSNPVILKSEFVLSLCEQLMGGMNLGAKQKSIIDRCTANVYREYQARGFLGKAPTLVDFHAELLRQAEPEAEDIALAIELFTNGSLNTFAKATNVDTENRIISYDIRDLGKQLMPIGMLVVLDSIFNRITKNRMRGRRTFVYLDEVYLLFQYEYSANFLFTLWKRVRKYGAFCTGITQNISDLLQSHTARTMLANSEFLILLNQAPTDRQELAKLINISEEQMRYISDADVGCGLMKVGADIIPFKNRFPENTKLYKLMTSKPGEMIYG